MADEANTPAGMIVLMETGEYSDRYTMVVCRAIKEIDWVTIKKECGPDSSPLMLCARLIRDGLLEELDHQVVWLGSSWYPGRPRTFDIEADTRCADLVERMDAWDAEHPEGLGR